ncbi:MAG: ABC transporter ATP-binding protein [Myxococcales bacterium]|nr:ABC transporter ATP-binding protein [Myxococcales bacterium]
MNQPVIKDEGAPPHRPDGDAPPRERIIVVERLAKTYQAGFIRKRPIEAVKDVSFVVERGKIVGFLGPNGSGKTTTIKMLLGLVAPTSGRATMFGAELSSVKARERLGYLPEAPYVYPYLTPREFVEMCGRLSGMRGASLRRRTEEVLDTTGVLYAADRQVRKLSKGMLQRSVLAAALVSDPELLVLDEPMSGLDPVGRKEVRDVILAERDRGRTVFFSTHILGDVEAFCDEVVILRAGEVVVSGAIRDLLTGDVVRTDILLAHVTAELRETLEKMGIEMREQLGLVVARVAGSERVGEVLRAALDANAQVVEAVAHRESLEDLFMRRAL